MVYRGSSSGSGRQDDKRNKRDPGDRDGPQNKKKSDKFDRFAKIDKDQDYSHGDSQEAMEGEQRADNEQDIQKDVLPIASFRPEDWTASTGKEMVMFDSKEAGTKDREVEMTISASMDIGAAIDPLLLNREVSELPQQESGSPQAPEEMIIPGGKIVVHGREGPYLMDEDKWPKLKEAEDKPSLSKTGVPKEIVVSQKSVASIILEDSDIEELT